jgi:CubicO group peptidase (beta-lactamase class C family)
MTQSPPSHKASRVAAAGALLALLSAMAPVPTGNALAAPPKPTADPRFQGLRQAMKRVSTQYQSPSISVAVTQGGKIVFEESIGWADIERRVQATPETQYSLATVTETVTATALMKLVDDKKLGLDDASSRHLRVTARFEPYEGKAADATVRRLLTHTAGLPPLQHYFYKDAGEQAPGPKITLKHYGILVYPPGETSIQSNLGYLALGAMFARLIGKGKGIDEFYGPEVFVPLGMSRTLLRDGAFVPNSAVRYGDDLKALAPYAVDYRYAAGLYGTVHDLARFAMFHLRAHLPDQKPILKDETILAMQSAVAPAESEGPGVFRGLGWMVKEDDYGYRRVWSLGTMPGATALLVLIPKESVSVAVLINRNQSAAAVDIADQGLAAVLPPFATALAAHPRPAPVADQAPARFAPTPALQGPWEGFLHAWNVLVPLKVRVDAGGAVRAKLGEQPDVALTDARLQGAGFTGRFEGTIPTSDATRHKHYVELTLRPRGPKLTGWASAVQFEGRPYGSLPHWVELGRPGTIRPPSPSPSTRAPKSIPEAPPPSPEPTPPPG